MASEPPAAPAPVQARRGVIDPAGVDRKERALLAVLRDRPGLTTAEIVAAIGDEKRSALVARLYRMATRGAIEKAGRGRWRIAGEEQHEQPEAAEPQTPPQDRPSRWVQSVNRYIRVSTDDSFSVARFG